ncbi:MAG: hypothetical protein M5R40_20560 [Anaerolineae bacterium]|nr:hypothetical protein [Anaerolineae bacterium]
MRDLKLKLEPNKTQLASFAQGFEFLGVHFYRDMYSYLWRQKRVEVKGKFVRPWQGPDGYE